MRYLVSNSLNSSRRNTERRYALLGRGLRNRCEELSCVRAASEPRQSRESVMYAAIRQMKVKTGTADDLAQRIKDAIPIISGVEGFMGYYVIYAPDDTETTISVFSRVEEAEESNRRALAWIDENLGPFLVGGATATAGPVIVHSLP